MNALIFVCLTLVPWLGHASRDPVHPLVTCAALLTTDTFEWLGRDRAPLTAEPLPAGVVASGAFNPEGPDADELINHISMMTGIPRARLGVREINREFVGADDITGYLSSAALRRLRLIAETEAQGVKATVFWTSGRVGGLAFTTLLPAAVAIFDYGVVIGGLADPSVFKVVGLPALLITGWAAWLPRAHWRRVFQKLKTADWRSWRDLVRAVGFDVNDPVEVFIRGNFRAEASAFNVVGPSAACAVSSNTARLLTSPPSEDAQTRERELYDEILTKALVRGIRADDLDLDNPHFLAISFRAYSDPDTAAPRLIFTTRVISPTR